MAKLAWEQMLSRLSALIDAKWEQQEAANRKERENERIQKRAQLESDRNQYVEFCERLVKAGAVAGKIPTFGQWRGDT